VDSTHYPEEMLHQIFFILENLKKDSAIAHGGHMKSVISF